MTTFIFAVKVLVSVVMVALTNDDYALHRNGIGSYFVLFVFGWGSVVSFADFFNYARSDLS